MPDGLSPFSIPATITLEAGNAPTRFDMVAYNGGLLRFPKIQYPVVIDLNGLDLKASTPIVKDHEITDPVGHTDRTQIVNGTLLASGPLSGVGAAKDTVVKLNANGFPWQASVSVDPISSTFVAKGNHATVNGRRFEGPVFVVTKGELREISFTSVGKDSGTAVRLAAAYEEGPSMAEDKTKIETNDSETVDLDAEKARIAKIEKLCATHSDILAKAISENWTPEKAELHVLRASYSKVRPQRINDGPDESAILRASLCASAGMSEKELAEHFEEKVIDASQSREHRGAGLQSVMHEVARRAGMSMPRGSFGSDHIRVAFDASRQLQASGLSSYSLPGIFSDSANKRLLSAYTAVGSVVSSFCAERDVKDYKKTKAYRLTVLGKFERVGNGGELKHARLEEAEYENQAFQTGKVIAIGEQDIVNDDISALSQVPAGLGRGAAIAREESVFDLLLDNEDAEGDAFFSSGNANYITGSNTTLTQTGLELGNQKFLKQVDANGRPILNRPSVLLVPSELDVTASQLMVATGVTGGSTNVLNTNPWAGRFQNVSSPYLSNTTFNAGGSAVAWYLFSNPSDIAAIEIVYVGGRQPRIETGNLDYDMLGIYMRGVFSYGVSFADFRGALKSKGAA